MALETPANLCELFLHAANEDFESRRGHGIKKGEVGRVKGEGELREPSHPQCSHSRFDITPFTGILASGLDDRSEDGYELVRLIDQHL